MVRLFFVCSCTLAAFYCSAQNSWQIRGQLSAYSDHYAFSAKNDSTLSGRRPNNFTRFVLTPYIKHQKGFKLPVTLIFSANQTNTLTPASSENNFKSFLYNPANVIRIAPQYKWATLQLGTIYPQYSDFTVGNISLFGAGIKLNPGKFLFEMSYGTSQRAISPDSILFIDGAYERTLWNTKVGFGHADSSFFFINATFANDNEKSLSITPKNIDAEQGLAIAPTFGLRFGKYIQWVNELGISIHTLNKNSSLDFDADEEINLPLSNVMSYNLTTRGDFAGSSSIKLKSKQWSFILKGLYVGPGFTTFGFPYFQNDRMDFTASPQVRLFKNKLTITGTSGYRINNLLETKAQTNTQILASFNVYAMLSKKLSLNASFANFGFRNDETSDSLKIQQISNTISLSPSYQTSTEKGDHALNMSLSQNDLSNFNTINGATDIIKSNNVGLYYQFAFKDNPMVIDLGGDYFENNAMDIGVQTTTINVGGGYRFFKRKLRTSVSVLMSQVDRINESTDNRFGAKLKLRYKSKSKYQFNLSISNNNYQYGSIRPDASFQEWFLKTGISKTL